jgi:hypothetical protein
VTNWTTWGRRRRLFVVEQLLFLALLVVGVVLVFIGHGVAYKVTWAIFILVVILANLVLRLTYFRSVLPEIREERARSRS